MARPRVRDIDRGYARTLRQLLLMANGTHAVAGIRGEAGAQREPPEEGSTAEPLTVVEIGAVQEFGTRDGHVPSRSYIRSTFDRQQGRYVSMLAQATPRILSGEVSPEDALELVGMRCAADIQRTIGTLRDPPLAQRTIDEKGSSKPLINTSRLRQSVSSEVRRRSA